jgi:hypothetical protein
MIKLKLAGVLAKTIVAVHTEPQLNPQSVTLRTKLRHIQYQVMQLAFFGRNGWGSTIIGPASEEFEPTLK